MKPTALFFSLGSLPEFDEIPAVETEADGLACNYLSPSQIRLGSIFYHKLLAVMDFIFRVDLSTAYVVLRRDFVTSQDSHGSLSSPVGAGFYCMDPLPGRTPPVIRWWHKTKKQEPLTNHKVGQTRPTLPTRRREHTAPKKLPRIGAS